MLIPYLGAMAAFVAGVCLLQLQPALPAVYAPLPLLLLGCFVAGRCHGRRRQLAIIVVMLITGFGWASLRAHWRMADRLDPALEQTRVVAEGYVRGLPQTSEFGVRFVFVPTRVLSQNATLPGRLSLSWWGEHPALSAGTRWQFTLQPRRVHGQQNPGGFDFEGWMLQQGIGATGQVKNGQALPGFAWQASIDRLREAVVQRITRTLGDAPWTGVIAAIATGDRSGIGREQWQDFARTGTTHLTVISGLHVSMIAALTGWLTGIIGRRLPRLLGHCNVRRLQLWSGLAAALLYTLLAGLGIPAQRAVLMLATGVVCLLWARPMSKSVIWMLALLAVVIADPFAVTAAGFWLSFLAVGALLWLGANRVGPAQGVTGWVRTQLAVTLGTLPVLLVVFGRLPLVSPLANAVAIPVIGMLVTPLTLAGIADPTGWLWQGAERLFAATHWFLALLLRYAPSPDFAPPPAWALVPALAGVWLFMLPRGLPGRWLGLMMAAPLFIVPAPAIAPGEFAATIIDVDQGLSVLVQTRHHNLLFDTGKPGQADRAILPVLRSRQVQRLDTLVVSHKDNDHSGSAEALLRALPVNHLLARLPPDHPAWGLASHDEACEAGQSWDWDGVSFTLLWPLPDAVMPDENAQGCVLEIETAHQRLLIPADVGTAQEYDMLGRNWLGHFDVVIAGHHGSLTSSSAAFVENTQPDWVVFSAGYLNRFRHPRPEIVARYAAVGAQDLRTDRDGAITLTTDGTQLSVRRWREQHRHYWYAE
ncbi:DNA internalization-related competence protein ComEC/Rec2 [Silvimonas iriomotensis]|uniref:DNA internalization-related competence protein ComEC/Rec2 n=1 Tax=Silvimonas iriomotensis TaxID=449662 RepID=A0ABQ2P8T3_9NEIS|nr:DNA internalization-related competence protein ComEC/Rec2 [Silvimonas iriomotensis]GGP20797.1 DNA internalization-related competence protein ComEC/Rec2 [Silvimonas iriomotensis]